MPACPRFCDFVPIRESPIQSDFISVVFGFTFLVQGIEPGPSDILSTHSATELHPYPVLPSGLASLAHLGLPTSHQWMPAWCWALQSVPYIMWNSGTMSQGS